ncbi:hypothetical protein LIZ76_17175 [Caldibacillus sp. 210928-DFI.2.22]|uniref:hypothetical protein n=1 Tax=unclassified Caldibacillus TaxID=2641266 RepID=UPI001D0754CA|nr:MULTISPECIES: hypothetical protein [unclassified Caldibacillus]MCB7071642.1 hypothetical protein [Caldibacillus sp. 210928-DFI.2.22]MCB7075062.1 hypothetical protein [Caldibacillus sp. 210928-DFI.2.18]
MKCAYCGKEAKGTKEHIISSAVLNLFPECFLTFDDARSVIHEADPMVKDVCADCNNNKIAYIDSYAKEFISQYFTRRYNEDDTVEIEYDYVMIQKMLLKYAFNDSRSHKEDCSFFDKEILHYIMNPCDNAPKENVTVLCGLAINVSPMHEAMFGNLKLRWCKNPLFYSNSTIRNIDYETGQIFLNENVEKEEFPDLQLSYIFRFNSVQFLLMCWSKNSKKIQQNNVVLEHQYPYHLMKVNDEKVALPICTNEFNYHNYEHIHVCWDGLFEVGYLRKHASGGTYKYKELFEKEWVVEEKRIKDKHPR